MKKVANIIDRVMKGLGLGKRYNEQKSILLWEKVVGQKISGKTKPLYARNGKLVVEVDNSAWMSELSFMKSEIIEKINRELGNWIIEDIHFFLKRG